jgi:thiamine monophosphate kinase
MARWKFGKAVNSALFPGSGIAWSTFTPDILMGTGDNAAIASSSPGSDLVSIVDLLREGVHFDLALISAHLLGRRALAVKG